MTYCVNHSLYDSPRPAVSHVTHMCLSEFRYHSTAQVCKQKGIAQKQLVMLSEYSQYPTVYSSQLEMQECKRAHRQKSNSGSMKHSGSMSCKGNNYCSSSNSVSSSSEIRNRRNCCSSSSSRSSNGGNSSRKTRRSATPTCRTAEQCEHDCFSMPDRLIKHIHCPVAVGEHAKSCQKSKLPPV